MASGSGEPNASLYFAWTPYTTTVLPGSPDAVSVGGFALDPRTYEVRDLLERDLAVPVRIRAGVADRVEQLLGE
ncbi:MAG: hypothetical protein MUF54_21035 [Polyangiaceae bacterium]|nr:hypothetical protein [Polyangiaceae bacterium]